MLVELGDVAGPVPTGEASEQVWDAWSDAAEFEAMLVGMVSRPREALDQALVVHLRDALAAPSLRSRLGDRLAIAESLVEALAGRSAPTASRPALGVSVLPSVGGVLERAAADVTVGNLIRARRRLKDRVRAVPTDVAARRALAELYRADGYHDQAGRWGYLVAGFATERERRAFLSAARYVPAFGRKRRQLNLWPATYTLRLLEWPRDVAHPDPGIADVLHELTRLADAEAARSAAARGRSLGEWAMVVVGRLWSPFTGSRRAGR